MPHLPTTLVFLLIASLLLVLVLFPGDGRPRSRMPPASPNWQRTCVTTANEVEGRRRHDGGGSRQVDGAISSADERGSSPEGVPNRSTPEPSLLTRPSAV